MTNKLGLTFGILIAHFIPGSVIILSIIFSHTKEIEPLIKDHPTIVMAVGSLLALACGLIVDAARYLLTWIPRVWKSDSDWCDYDVSRASEDDRKYFDWITEHDFRFHQFYGNMSLALLFSASILSMKWQYTLVVILLCLVCAISAILTYHRTITDLRSRFSRKGQGG